MIIRKMMKTDLPEVCKIENEIFSEPWNEHDFYNSIQDSNNGYFVAQHKENIVGYCGYWGIAGEGYIYNVAVEQEYRRQKIAFSLLQELVKDAMKKGIESLTLEVRCSNRAAIQLYEQMGFKQEGIRKGFYSKPKEDAVIMWWKPIQ